MKLPDIRFSEYFADQNHAHNVDESDVLDTIVGRRIYVSARYIHNGKPRRKVLAKTDSAYLTIICEEADVFWWVISAFPSGKVDERRARGAGIGLEDYDA